MAYFSEIVMFIILAAIWLAISFEFEIELTRITDNSNERPKNKVHIKFNIMKKNVQYFKSLLTAEQLQKVVKFLIASYVVYICIPTIQSQ